MIKKLGVSILSAFLALLVATSAFAIPIKCAEAPFNDLALTVQAIMSAKNYLLVNIYELTSPDVAAALLNRIKAGVHVEVLQEGSPVGGMSFSGHSIQAQLASAMSRTKDDRLFEMTSKGSEHRRYHYDHAKYIVVDGQDLLIGSENYSPSGNPEPGSPGNRGWEVLIHDSDLAAQFKAVFRNDADPSKGDVLELSRGPQETKFEKPVTMADPAGLKDLAHGLPIYNADSVKPILSPDTSKAGLLAMIASARISIDIQQMSFDSAWGPTEKSPLALALLAAARHGVAVRVLLNDERTFDRPGHPTKPKNRVTVKILNQLAAKEKLKLAARVADVEAMGVSYIHNKGALIDGEYTLVSSINWGENSVENNREAAVLIDSRDVNAHYQKLFSHDWAVSGTTDDTAQKPKSVLDDTPEEF